MLQGFQHVRPVLPGEVGDSGLQRADEASHAISRTAALSRRGAEELLQGEPDDLRGLALHPPGRALQGSAEVIGQAHGELGWHRRLPFECIVMQYDARAMSRPLRMRISLVRSAPIDYVRGSTNKRGPEDMSIVALRSSRRFVTQEGRP